MADSAKAKPVYALVGADALLQQEGLQEIAGKLARDVQRIELDGEAADLAELLDELRSFAMFGSGKLVIVRNADAFLTKFRSQLEDYVASPSDSATLVLRLSALPANQRIYKAIQKVGEINPCEPPKDVAKWIAERGKRAHGIAVSAEAARLLADLVGNDLGRLNNELAKLALLSDSGKIAAEDIAGTVAFQRERQMWDLTSALGAGDPAEALARWRQLVQMDSSAEFRAVTWLCIWLENVRKAQAMLKQGQNAFSIGQALRIWPREVQAKFVETVKALGPQGLARAVNLLAEIDFQTKTGVGDAAENVERFILALAPPPAATGRAAILAPGRR